MRKAGTLLPASLGILIDSFYKCADERNPLHVLQRIEEDRNQDRDDNQSSYRGCHADKESADDLVQRGNNGCPHRLLQLLHFHNQFLFLWFRRRGIIHIRKTKGGGASYKTKIRSFIEVQAGIEPTSGDALF